MIYPGYHATFITCCALIDCFPDASFWRSFDYYLQNQWLLSLLYGGIIFTVQIPDGAVDGNATAEFLSMSDPLSSIDR